MRRLPLLAAVSLLAVACAAETLIPQTTTTVAVAEPSTTTTAVAVATTTTVEPEGPVDICSRGLSWEPGTTYRADCFAVPLTLHPEHGGWTSAGGGEDWLKLRWSDPAIEGSEVRGAVLAYRSSGEPEDVLDQLTSHELITEISKRTTVAFDGMAGLLVDVEGAPEPGGELLAPDGVPCSPDSPVWWRTGRFGHTIVNTGEGEIGVGACHVVRFWVIDAGGTTIAILGGTADPDRHAEAVAKIEELLEGVSFDVGAGS